MRVRKVVTRSGKRIRGKFPSAKMNRMVHWESLFERDAILHLEYHPLVVSYQEQPSIETYYDAAGEAHLYYPDFCARFVHGNELYIEVKPKRYLATREVRLKLEAVAWRFREQEREFRVMTEEAIRREPLFSNLKTIHRSTKKVANGHSSEQFAHALTGGPSWSFKDLAAQMGSVRDALVLIRAGHLRVDLEATLIDDSTVWLAGAAGGSHGSFRI